MKITEYFIPQSLKEPKEVYWRAKIIVQIHLMLIMMAIVSWLACTFVLEDNEFPHEFCLLAIFASLYVFKKFQSFKISGNLICFVLVLALYPFSFTTGGLYSYDFMALILVPITAFLIADRKSGFIWLAFLLGATFLFYYLETNSGGHYREIVLNYEPVYYLNILILLFLIIVLPVAIFDKGQRMIIKELNNQRDLLQEKQVELEKTQDELLESNEGLQHFAHVASHDLKQPIRTIKSFGELLQRDIGKDLPEKYREYLTFITAASNQLGNQVDSILNHAMVGSGELTRVEEIETLPFLENILLGLQKQFIDSKASSTIRKVPTTFKGSKVELSLVFQNIISNSLKFKHPDRPMQIVIAGKALPEFWEFSIADNGVGVEPKILKDIFSPMIKSRSQQNKEGTGMGLATCQKIINRHHGEIKVESVHGEGATFIFTINKNVLANKSEIDQDILEVLT